MPHLDSELKSVPGGDRSVIETDSVVETSNDAPRFLGTLKSFSQLPANELKALANSWRFATFESGQYITTEGDKESLYGFIVVSGRVAMIKTSINGKDLVVELLPRGDMIGLFQSLSPVNLPIQLSARAQGKYQILWVPMTNFTAVLDAHPKPYQV